MKDINHKLIGKKIRARRISLGLTQECLAIAADVNISHISNIETGRSKVSLPTLVNICNALDTTVDCMLNDEYKIEKDPVEQAIFLELRRLKPEMKEKLLKITKALI